MITLEAREAMNDIDDIAEEQVSDMRIYNPRRDYYETAFDVASEYGCSECVQRFKDRLARRIQNEDPPNKLGSFRFVRKLLREDGHSIPAHSEVHSVGSSNTRDPWA